ncbi:hypothetical protein VTK26DRAFT_5664 [Humicola hyalothermophila]
MDSSLGLFGHPRSSDCASWRASPPSQTLGHGRDLTDTARVRVERTRLRRREDGGRSDGWANTASSGVEGLRMSRPGLSGLLGDCVYKLLRHAERATTAQSVDADSCPELAALGRICPCNPCQEYHGDQKQQTSSRGPKDRPFTRFDLPTDTLGSGTQLSARSNRGTRSTAKRPRDLLAGDRACRRSRCHRASGTGIMSISGQGLACANGEERGTPVERSCTSLFD